MSVEQKTILVVEDDPDTADLIRQLFESSDVKGGGEGLVFADNEYKAQQLIEQAPPDLILLNIRLQGRDDGLKILLQNPTLKTVVMTAYPGEKIRERVFGLGAVDFFSKPFEDISHFKARLLAILDGD